MPWSLIPPRHDLAELMDEAGLPEGEVAEAYRVLRKVNRQLGNLWVARRELNRLVAEDRPRIENRLVTLLDVGSGSGDVPIALSNHLAKRFDAVKAWALDRDPTAVNLAAIEGVETIRGDALHLPFGDASLDLVTAVKFAHHFRDEPLRRLVAEMARVARLRVIVLDIRRHWLAYYGFSAWSRVFTRNRLVRNDGPISVLRGFTADELLDVGRSIPGFAWRVTHYPGFQLALVGRRISS